MLSKHKRPENQTSKLPRVESFEVTAQGVQRLITRRDGSVVTTDYLSGIQGHEAADPNTVEKEWLRTRGAPDESGSGPSISVVDLFSGCGGLSLGAREASRALGFDFSPALAIDFEPAAAAVYAKNFPSSRVLATDISLVFDRPVGATASRTESKIRRNIGEVDILMGGPPCQGHSDLNNRTRRMDPKNELYFTMIRAAEVLEPKHVIIENVPGAINDKSRVVQRSAEALSELGYNVDFGVVDASSLGVPQRRRRLILMASRSRMPSVVDVEINHAREPRGLAWAIDDLTITDPQDPFNQPANSASETRRRIDFLFDNDLFDLPNEMRPECHREKAHTYRSVYGRLKWGEPSPTMTTGFYSMCMGRYVHPSERRTLTAHEAARVQYFPDGFDFSAVASRTELARMIGNAVPSRLAYAIVLELLR